MLKGEVSKVLRDRMAGRSSMTAGEARLDNENVERESEDFLRT